MRLVRKVFIWLFAWYFVGVACVITCIFSCAAGVAVTDVLLHIFLGFLAKMRLAPISVLNMEVLLSLVIIAGMAVTGIGTWVSSRHVWRPLSWIPRGT